MTDEYTDDEIKQMFLEGKLVIPPFEASDAVKEIIAERIRLSKEAPETFSLRQFSATIPMSACVLGTCEHDHTPIPRTRRQRFRSWRGNVQWRISFAWNALLHGHECEE